MGATQLQWNIIQVMVLYFCVSTIYAFSGIVSAVKMSQGGVYSLLIAGSTELLTRTSTVHNADVMIV